MKDGTVGIEKINPPEWCGSLGWAKRKCNEAIGDELKLEEWVWEKIE